MTSWASVGSSGASSGSFMLASHQHGKSRVRLGRVWREGSRHYFVEWRIEIVLLSDVEAAFARGDNSGVVATDSIKNTVYVLAKELKQRVSVEDFGIKLAEHFVKTYPQVSKAMIRLQECPWKRVSIDGQPHDHGFTLGAEKHTAEVSATSTGTLSVRSGVANLSVLKTTQSGFEGFVRDKYTSLPESKDRILATSITASWRYKTRLATFQDTWEAVRGSLLQNFFGPEKEGIYSPSVQKTLYEMACAVLARYPSIDSVHLNMPNLHFLPVNMPLLGVKFENDVFLPTDEPHGSIEATVTRAEAADTPRARL
eukprot:TRINITY_DN5135_c0_g3_i2.p1 TRINITY_DN5135_c0_g3~~TRINITY_DN5135_c0_g3_i2.p1  ORF type:complete len:312 (-),score=41.77 TRINITY_DN5135_c0_g3_i2:816-1751(-)